MKPTELKYKQEVLIALEDGAPIFAEDGTRETQRAFKGTVCETTERGLFILIDCFNYFEWDEIRDIAICTDYKNLDSGEPS